MEREKDREKARQRDRQTPTTKDRETLTTRDRGEGHRETEGRRDGGKKSLS